MIREEKTSTAGVSRRRFLGRLAGGSAAAVVGLAEARTSLAATLQSLRTADTGAGRPDDGGYWEKVRKHFILEDGFAYLNTGTLGPTPRPVV